MLRSFDILWWIYSFRSRSLNFRLKTRDRFQSKASREPGASSKSDPSLDSVRCKQADVHHRWTFENRQITVKRNRFRKKATHKLNNQISLTFQRLPKFVHWRPNSSIFLQGKYVRRYHKTTRNTQLNDIFREFWRFRSQKAKSKFCSSNNLLICVVKLN